MNTSYSPGSERSGLDNPVVLLLVLSYGYVTTSEGSIERAQVETAIHLVNSLSGENLSANEVANAWEHVRTNRTEVFKAITTGASGLTEQQKQLLLSHCVLIGYCTGHWISNLGEQSCRRLAAALGLPDSVYTEAAQVVVEGMRNSGVNLRQRETPTPSSVAGQTYKPSRRFRKRNVVVAVVLAVACVLTADYFYDRNLFLSGYAAYSAADCVTASSDLELLRDHTLLGYGLPNLQNYSAESQEYLSHCRELAAGDRARNDSNYASAAVSYLNVEHQTVPDFIRTKSQEQLRSLLTSVRPESLASIASCDRADRLREQGLAEAGDDAVPLFLATCAEIYDTSSLHTFAFEMYVAVLDEFPDSLVTSDIENTLLTSELACDSSAMLLEYENILARSDFLGQFYLLCGERYEKSKEYGEAVRVYREFMDSFDEHEVMEDIQQAYSRNIYYYARETEAPEIPAPPRSGATTWGRTVVIIQNDSPERMRISFSGPESRVEELEQCSTCRTFSGEGPEDCPDRGPVGTYTLVPGSYNVVVESISDSDIIPWAGQWSLDNGDEYSSCFFIVTSRSPNSTLQP